MTSNELVLVYRDCDPEWEEVAKFVHGFAQVFLAFEFSPRTETLLRDMAEMSSGVVVAIVLDDSNSVKALARPNRGLDNRCSQDVLFMLGFARALIPETRILIVTRGDVQLAPELDGFAKVWLDLEDWKTTLRQEILSAGIGP